jgi:CBS domain-containing protein
LFVFCGQDIATRVIAEGLRPEQTIVSKIMTRNPIFVTSDSLALEALQKMVQGELYILHIFFFFVMFIFGALLKLVICYKLKSA